MVLAAAAALAETPDPKPEQKKPAQKQEEQEPPEEDAAANAKVYSFNPLQAQKELRTGLFYYKKGSYRAAANRFQEATKWNPNFGEAWLRLGEAAEKQHDEKVELEAYSKYLELQPDAKDAGEIRKKTEALKKKLEKSKPS
jgi:tetratricopeptide (TPR) repeat protein